MDAALTISNLTKRYGDFTAVDDVSFSIDKGEIFGLLGPNGAGKTSIISILTTLAEATSGSVSIFGLPPRKARHLIGCVPQELIHHGYFTVYDILVSYSSYYGIWHNEERIEFLLRSLSLWNHREKQVSQLSGGMKRRLLIAKALVHQPKLLILDEPTAGVDIELRSQLWEFVKELRENEGLSVLLTTHYLEEAEQLCDRIGILQYGRLKRIGSTSDLLEELTHRTVKIRLSSPIGSLSHPNLVEQEGDQLAFTVPRRAAITNLLTELGISLENIEDLHIREGTLEDAVNAILR
jgi:ABC-2 type transport system ATP-binding protein